MFILFIFYALFLAYFGIFSHDDSIFSSVNISPNTNIGIMHECVFFLSIVFIYALKRFVLIYGKIIFIHCIFFVKIDLDILKYEKDLLFLQSHDCAYSQQIYIL